MYIKNQTKTFGFLFITSKYFVTLIRMHGFPKSSWFFNLSKLLNIFQEYLFKIYNLKLSIKLH